MKLYLSGADYSYKASAIKNVESAEEASELTIEFIEKHDLGSRTFNYGFVTDDNKNLLYVIAYNGRIFKPEDYFGEGGGKVSLDSDIGKIAVRDYNYKR